jgi:hypothetical protein
MADLRPVQNPVGKSIGFSQVDPAQTHVFPELNMALWNVAET